MAIKTEKDAIQPLPNDDEILAQLGYVPSQ